MMKEILGVTEEPHARRRWFHDEYFDLFVWQTAGGELVSFQLCYGINADEQALVWNKTSGFFHDGKERAGSARSSDSAPGSEPMLARLDIAAADLPADIRPTLLELVREYSSRQPAVPARRKRFRRADWQKLTSQTR